MLRRLLERLARDTAIRRHLPSHFGDRPLYVSGDSALSYLKPRWAASSQSLLDAAATLAKDTMSVWDIGSNCGVFAFAAAHVAATGAEVLALEADPFMASLIQRSAREPANQDLRVRVVCAAVSNQVGVARFEIAERGRSSNSLQESGHRSEAGGTRFTVDVPTITLDKLLTHFRPPDVVKIDVEGAEVLALSGGTEVLTRVRPTIYVEVGEEQNATVTRMLRDHRYLLLDAEKAGGGPLDRCTFNTLAIPAEKGAVKA